MERPTPIPAQIGTAAEWRIEWSYDDMGRQILLTSYDASSGGNIVNEVASAYGGWGNMVAEWQSHDGPVTEFTPVVEYVFDDGATGEEARYVRLAVVIYPDGKVLEYVRDPVPGRIRVITLDGVTNAVYHYRGLNAATGYDFPVTDGVMSKILTIDRFARVADLSWQHDDSTLVEQFQYTHDRGSRRTARLQPLNTAYSEWYVYDRFHQLVDMQRQRGDAQAWDLEHAGNWAGFQDNNKSQTRDHNAVNELTAIDGVTQSVEHDAAGNMTRIPKQAPWNKHYTCRWDAWNRLVEVFEGANLVVRSGYDGNSRRIWKYDGHEIRDFYYDGWNVLDDVATRASGITTNAYCWGIDLSDSLQGAGGIGGLLSWTEGISPAAFYYSDANGNVAKVVDATGTNTLAEYQYDPYGTPIRAVGPEASANPYRFSSKYMDDETGLLYYGYRYYDPKKGRWLSRDPIEEFGGINLYGFVGNDGVNSWDYLGYGDIENKTETTFIAIVSLDPLYYYVCVEEGKFKRKKTTDIAGVMILLKAKGTELRGWTYHSVDDKLRKACYWDPDAVVPLPDVKSKKVYGFSDVNDITITGKGTKFGDFKYDGKRRKPKDMNDFLDVKESVEAGAKHTVNTAKKWKEKIEGDKRASSRNKAAINVLEHLIKEGEEALKSIQALEEE